MAWLYCSSLPSNLEMMVGGWVFFMLFLFAQTNETLPKAPLFFQETDLRTSMGMKWAVTHEVVQETQNKGSVNYIVYTLCQDKQCDKEFRISVTDTVHLKTKKTK